jgi:hypothetical protein
LEAVGAAGEDGVGGSCLKIRKPRENRRGARLTDGRLLLSPSRKGINPNYSNQIRFIRSGKTALGKAMASADKKTSPAPKSGAAEKKEVAVKKGEGQPKDKTTLDADRSKAESGEKAASSPSGYSRGEGQKPVSKAYRDNWNAIYARKKKKKR